MKTFKLSFRATGIFVTYLLGVCILLVSCGIYTDNSFSVSQTNSYDLSDRRIHPKACAKIFRTTFLTPIPLRLTRLTER